jgi:hypothetical protein
MNLTINCLLDEILLEIFDACRRRFVSYDLYWRKKHAWLNLVHVCRRWRAVVFASSSRLDLSVTVGPKNPNHIKTILSSALPIFIKYEYYPGEETTGSALWRMRAALKCRDRVRGISIGGKVVDLIEFIKEIKHHLPALESLDFPSDRELDISATFLRRPDQSDLRLRRLRLCKNPAAVSGLLLSATTLIVLTLDFRNDATGFDPSQVSVLLACLQGMLCLHRLYLTTPDDVRDYQSLHSTHKDIVPLLKLTYFGYSGSTIFLNNFMSGLSAPSLRHALFVLNTYIGFPLLHLPRVIDDVREEFRSVSVAFGVKNFLLSSWTHSGNIDRTKPSFRLNMNCLPGLIKSINSTPTAKFAMVEELGLLFTPLPKLKEWFQVFPMREFLRQFRSVRLLRLDFFTREIVLYLQQDDGEAIFPVLEEIDISKSFIDAAGQLAIKAIRLRARTSGSPCKSLPFKS